ncbi:hypothetical protein Taro_040217 [Colocasia esculenta]|uniref:Uncharacterized protein n=1 Tax=Colocasia esculenta TaxID=4460 RepID=A0A843WL65_COLES|nr:hypothetical protein [Colocasia esculenta]
MTDQIKYRTAYTMDRYFKSRIISKEIGHIHRYHVFTSNQTYHIKRRHNFSQLLLICLCYAKHQKSILPRLISTLGCSSPGPDQALFFAQALDQMDRSPKLCRLNIFTLWPQSFNNKLIVKGNKIIHRVKV